MWLLWEVNYKVFSFAPAAYNSKTINDNEIKLGGVVKDY